MKKQIELPKPLDERGYTSKELLSICEVLNIDKSEFSKALGVNTVCINENGETLTYACDVENALHYMRNETYLFFD